MISGKVSVFLGVYGANGRLFEKNPPSKGSKTYILKGAPGCGQRVLLQSIAEIAVSDGKPVSLIHSALDPRETEGIYLPDSDVWIIDGSRNPALEPHFIGIREQLVDLGQCVQTERLAAHEDEILARYHNIEELRARADRFLSAAGTMLSDSFHLALGALDIGKTRRFAATLAKRWIPAVRRESVPARETRLFLSGYTGRGSVFFEDSLHKWAENIIVIDDEFGAASRILLTVLRQKAIDRGYSVISCLCGLHGEEKLDHLLIPELSVGFCTSNRYHPVKNFTQRIHLRRFTDAETLRKCKQRLSFNRRAVRELTAGVCELLCEIRAEDRRLEAYYRNALDTRALNGIIEKIIRGIYPSGTE